MPRVQTFVTKEVIEQIESIIKQRIGDGASPKEVNLSSMTGQLVELGLKVYNIQQEGDKDKFDQMAFNLTLLENAVTSRMITAKMMAVMKLLPDLKDNPVFDLSRLRRDVKSDTDEIMNKIFPSAKVNADE